METDKVRDKIVFHLGMPRTGSTFLYSVFSSHPEVFLPPVKEINYFNFHYKKSLSWYFDFFKGIKEEKVAFDFFPSAFTGSEAIKNILDFNPNAKVILGLRKPSDFSVSCFKHFKLISSEKDLSYEDFLKKGIKVFDPGSVSRVEKAISSNHVIETASKCLEQFKENILIYSYESIEKDPLSILKSIEGFLGLSPFFDETNFKNRKVNSSDREVSKVFLAIRSNPFLYKTVLRLFPHKLLSAFSVFVANFAVRNLGKKDSNTNVKVDSNLAIAREVYKGADDYYESLFSGKSLIQLGDGRTLTL